MMVVLGAVAVLGYAILWNAHGFWALLGLTLIAGVRADRR